jgi:hypothetical protein
MANCVTKFFTKKGTAFTETRGVVIEVKISDKITWDFYSGNNFVAFDGGVPYIVGKWGCDGDENFTITGDVTKTDGTKKNQTFSSKTPDNWTDTQTSQISPSLYCVINGLKSMGKTWKIGKDKSIVADMGVGAGDMVYYIWYFYPPKENRNSWVEYNFLDKKVTLSGTWSCLDSTNFKLTRSDGKTYIGGGSGWEEPTVPESITEPTYDKSKFPLKLNSQGPEVAQLQNYLNKLIPFEPLVVNGLFDKKTQDKLKQLQKNLPI